MHFEIILTCILKSCLIQPIFNIPGIIDVTPEQLECCITQKLSIRLQLALYKNIHTPEFSNIAGHPTKKISNPKVFLLTKIKPEFSDILYNPTHFPGPLVCRIRQVPLHCLMGQNILHY